MKTNIKILHIEDTQFNTSGCTLYIYYTNKADGSIETFSSMLSEESVVKFQYPENVQIEDRINITLKAPEGHILSIQDIRPENIIGKPEFQFSFRFNKVDLTQGISNIIPVSKTINGKLLDSRAKVKTDNVQIIISVSTAEAPETFIPIATTQTESGGYFVIGEPAGNFEAAIATIGLTTTQQIIPIPLELSNNGSNIFPQRLLLVFESEAPSEENNAEHSSCGCNEFNFHEQGRVLDEFSFYSIIRTSDPEIKSFEIIEDSEITLESILDATPGRAVPMFELIKANPVSFFGKNKAISNIRPSSTARATSAATRASSATINEQQLSKLLKEVKIKKSVARKFLDTHKVIDKSNLKLLLEANEAAQLDDIVQPEINISRGRLELDVNNQIDWDDKPTIYEATSIAYGHLLNFKQQWIADGYSLGDLIYSLPLAPGQKKQIVTYDWEHRLVASDQQELTARESLANVLSRDRDINEIASGTINEKMSGSSSATVSSAAAGLGLAIGPMVFGAAGGISKASSSASQQSMRSMAASNAQQLSDKTMQSSSSLRSQRSTVIQTVTQGETSSVTSESVANYNHCHAITIQYFEVLRHFKVQQKLADVQECLFIPLPITAFDIDKARRWKEILSDVILDKKLRKAFGALQRVKDQWEHSDFPADTFAAENVRSLTGNLKIQIDLVCPADKFVDATHTEFEPANWTWMQSLGLGDPLNFYNTYLRDKTEKDNIFRRQLGDKIAQRIKDYLRFSIIDDSSNTLPLNVDASLTSSFYNGVPLNFSLRAGETNIPRERFVYFNIALDTNAPLPEFTKIIIRSGSASYRTKHKSAFLFNYTTIQDDLSISDNSMIYCGPTHNELKNPKEEDVEYVNDLMYHLNANLEYYHTAIWKFMPPERRFMLLDGIKLFIPKEHESRSVASLVENRLIGIIGNSMVLPVIPGLNLNPDFSTEMLNEDTQEIVPLKQFYDHEPLDPLRISIPTRGVFAESVIGSCNSCEIKDEQRFWRWEESPIPDSPTAIAEVSVATPALQTPNLQVNPLPASILNIQTAPEAPAPSSLTEIFELLGKGDIFKDITGLSENQKNAIEGLKSAFTASENFATKALEKAKFDKMAKLLEDGKISLSDFNKANSDANKDPMLQKMEDINQAEKDKDITTNQAEVLNEDLKPLTQQIADIKELVASGDMPKDQAAKLIEDLIRFKMMGASPQQAKPEEKAKPQETATGNNTANGNSTNSGNT